MNALDLLKKDHEKVKRLFEEYDSDNNRRRDIANMVFDELEIHSRIEEDIFYPAVRAKAKKDGKELIKHSIEEHQEVDDLINELRSMDPEEEDFDDRFQELIEDVEHHIDLEESETFPKAQQLLGSDLDELGRQIEEEKETAKAR